MKNSGDKMSTKRKILCVGLIILGVVVASSDARVGGIFLGLGIIGLFPNFGLFAKSRNRVIEQIAEGRRK